MVSETKLSFNNNSYVINLKYKHLNIGKFKGVHLSDVPGYYLKWVIKNIQLSEYELNMIRSYIKYKKR
jgi:uncharacterized protein (DUF3820 family)